MEAKTLQEIQIVEICKILSSSYPVTNLSNREDPLEEAIFILLTSQTDENKYLKTWEKFHNRFPTMENAYKARKLEVYRSIKDGGLGKWKAQRIKNILKYVKKEFGKLSLNSLKDMGDQELENELLKLDGISLKSARCIMMYSFGREVFPVDTHVLRIAKKFGFKIPDYSIKSKKFADAIQEQVPAEFRYRFHVNLVQHGRTICKKNPKCIICPVNHLCFFGIESVKRVGEHEKEILN